MRITAVEATGHRPDKRRTSHGGVESADDGSFLWDPTKLAESERIATAPRRLAPKLL